MKIAHYYPNNFSKLFEKHVDGVEFFDNVCPPDVDIIYAGSTSQLNKALKAAKECNKPICCWCWDISNNFHEWGMDTMGLRENAARPRRNKATIERLRECDLIISGSKSTQSVLKNDFDIDSEQLYFYIDNEGLRRCPENEKTNSVIQISRYYYNKRFQDSIRALKKVNGFNLTCIGTKQSKYYFNYLVELAGQDTTFYVKLPRQELINHLKQSQVLVSPSVHEGWGISPIESIACEVPILLSDLEVFKEVWEDNIIYHQKFDSNDLSEKLKMLLANKALQKDIVTKCKPIIADFTPEKFAKRWHKLIKQL